jgi:two-component system, chemotaxis family, response regulator PixG
MPKDHSFCHRLHQTREDSPMNTISMVSHKPFQRLHPLSLLAQLISRQANGCLQVVSGSSSWLIYLDQGQLTFATSSGDPFERLDRHLHRLSASIPALGTVRSQVRLLYENAEGNYPSISADYQAICWLVEQRFLNVTQATALIEAIAKDVIAPFLSVTEGMYEVIDKQNFAHYPQICRLDLRPIVEQCHHQLRPAKIQSPDLPREAPTYPGSQQMPELSQAPAINRVKPTSGPATKTRYTVACIDDSPTILQAISTFLDDANFSVLMINDPIKALMQVVRSKPDMILLDVGMPNLDGYELCSLLRRHPSFKNTPIIMVTGHTGFIDRARAKLVGASGYLTKPFTQSELLKTMFKFLT